MITEYEINISDREFKNVWKQRERVADLVLSDKVTLPICDTIKINKANLNNQMHLCRFDRLCILPTSKSVDDMAAIVTMVLDIDSQGIKLLITSTLGPTRRNKIPFDVKVFEPKPKEIDAATLKQVRSVFSEENFNFFATERRLGIGAYTIYKYLNHDGTPTDHGRKLLG